MKIQKIKDLINENVSREPIAKIQEIKNEINTLFENYIKIIGPESSIFEIIENLQKLDLLDFKKLN